MTDLIDAISSNSTEKKNDILVWLPYFSYRSKIINKIGGILLKNISAL